MTTRTIGIVMLLLLVIGGPIAAWILVNHLPSPPPPAPIVTRRDPNDFSLPCWEAEEVTTKVAMVKILNDMGDRAHFAKVVWLPQADAVGGNYVIFYDGCR